ncbi:MAG: DoxX family protein [Bacteroidota bacterium]
METTSKAGKTQKIIYWIFTIWMSLGMTSSAIVQLMGTKEEADMLTRLGYPLYFMTILGVWKILGVITVLVPKFLILKEWAYAGFFFVTSGAVISHLAVGDSFKEFFPSVFLLALTAISWYFRPPARKIAA